MRFKIDENLHDDVAALLDRWLSDDSGYDEAAWPELKTGLDQNRVSARRLFDGEADSA